MYDIKNNILRDYHIEDNYTFTLDDDYEEIIYNETLESFLIDIIPNEQHREYLLYILSTLLDDSTPNDLVYFLIGSGSNGKSLFLELVQLALGKMSSNV